MFVAGDGPSACSCSPGRAAGSRRSAAGCWPALGATAASYRWFGETDRPGAAGVLRGAPGDAARAVRAAGRAGDVEGRRGRAAARVRCTPRSTPWSPSRRRTSCGSGLSAGAARSGRRGPARGEPLSFVPYDDDWEPDTEPAPSSWACTSRAFETYADDVPAARIPVEDSTVRCCWSRRRRPALALVPLRERVDRVPRARRAPYRPGHAGHRGPPVRAAGGRPLRPRWVNAHGGTPEADAELGRLVWPVIAGRSGSAADPVDDQLRHQVVVVAADHSGKSKTATISCSGYVGGRGQRRTSSPSTVKTASSASQSHGVGVEARRRRSAAAAPRSPGPGRGRGTP